MATLPDPAARLKPSVVAALLLLAQEHQRQLAFESRATTGAILEATGASRSQAYAMRQRLQQILATLHEPAGRPQKTSAPIATVESIIRAVRDYVYRHPGAVKIHGTRRQYSDGYRTFVVGLCSPGGLAETMTVETFADCVGVPVGTMKAWLSPSKDPNPSGGKLDDDSDSREPYDLAAVPSVATILTEYPDWDGGLVAFCKHLREHHRLRCSKKFVTTVLQAAGLHRPKPRGKPKMAPWSRNTFRRLFPGAQWLGDGTQLAIEVSGERYVFNLEAVLDVYTNAVVGVDVSDVENEDALLTAFYQGIVTAAQHPHVLSVDRKPCNHTPLVHDSIAPTQVLPSTPGRGQAKAGLEGTFGLFQQTTPPLVVAGDTQRQLARSVLALVCTVWAWARNGRPRQRLGQISPAHAYHANPPTQEQITQTRHWLAELERRADATRKTAERRADPVRRQLIREALIRHGIDDPAARLEIAIAGYGFEAVLRGIAAFDAKTAQGTIPPDADMGRYLGGVVRNLDAKMELDHMADALLALRLRRNDLSLRPLENALEQLRREHEPSMLPGVLVERALDACASIDVRFFTRAAADALAALPSRNRLELVPTLTRRVAARFAATKQRRADIIAHITEAATR